MNKLQVADQIPEADVAEYVMARFRDVEKANRISALVEYQAMNKYLIMSRDQAALKAMGNIVAGHKRGRLREVLKEYRIRLEKVLEKRPTTRTHSNVIQHILGHFSRSLDAAERRRLHCLLERFRAAEIGIGGTLAEINRIVFRLNNTYLASQTYFLLYSDPIQDMPRFLTGNGTPAGRPGPA